MNSLNRCREREDVTQPCQVAREREKGCHATLSGCKRERKGATQRCQVAKERERDREHAVQPCQVAKERERMPRKLVRLQKRRIEEMIR